MTCRMVAGEPKKGLESPNLHEQYRGKKKKKLDSSDYMLNLRSHIYLEWDNNEKKAVAKREQVGITWRDMAPFVDSVPKSHSGLADVFSIPQEIFGLENVTEVLSYEVWATCLSESERKLLTQFLPSGTGAEQVMHSLLMGENHHFGNPYLNWSASLCSGNLHPDVVLSKERELRASRKAYYSELQKYHTCMIHDLKMWKERWISCEDPEKFLREGLTKHKQGSLSISEKRVAPISKKKTPHKICMCPGDITKYMSYIKISRTQHKLVKNIKHSGDGIQSKSLNCVLGDIKGFHVRSYEKFVEEEKKRLHEHWLRLATKDIQAAFKCRRDKKLQRGQWRKSLEQELAENNKVIPDEDEETSNMDRSPQEQLGIGDTEHLAADVLDQEDVGSTFKSTHDHHLERVPFLNTRQELRPMVPDQAAFTQYIPKPAEGSPLLSHSVGKTSPAEDITEPMPSIPSPKDMWQTVSNQNFFYQTTPKSHGHISAAKLSVSQPHPIQEHPASVIDLERDVSEQEAGEPVATQLFSYPNQGRSELLPPFPKGPGNLFSYQPEHTDGLRQTQLQFLTENNSFSGPGQFPHEFQEQQNQHLQQRQLREEELYMHQMINKNVNINVRYPSRGHLPLQSSINGGLVSHSWFPGEQQVCSGPNGRSGVESTGSIGLCLRDGGIADGSLFSVLNECSSPPSYDTTRSEQFMQARGYIGGGVPNNAGVYAYDPHSRDAAAAPTLNNVPWMNLPNQNPSLPGSVGKSFSKSWNL